MGQKRKVQVNSTLILLNVANNSNYYIPINDTTFELSVFWPSDKN